MLCMGEHMEIRYILVRNDTGKGVEVQGKHDKLWAASVK